jgi:hypothetical protein
MTTVAESLICLGSLIRLTLLTIVVMTGCCRASDAVMPEELPAAATNVEGLVIPDLKILQHQNRLYFVLPDQKPLPASIKLPRIVNIVLGVRWLSEEKATMQVKSEPTEWTIVLSQPPEDAARVIVAELDAPVELYNEDVVARPDKVSGIILLPARYAATHGTSLRFEPQPHKNTVGYWSNVHDTAEWSFQNSESGTWEIDILQGCGTGHGGSRVTLQVAGQSLDFVVQETGHFQNFIWRTLGSVTLKGRSPGEKSTLKLVPQSKPGGAVMDVRAIRLCPAGIRRSFAPELADPESLPIEIKR